MKRRRLAARKYVKVLLLSPNKLANATGCRLCQALCCHPPPTPSSHALLLSRSNQLWVWSKQQLTKSFSAKIMWRQIRRVAGRQRRQAKGVQAGSMAVGLPHAVAIS